MHRDFSDRSKNELLGLVSEVENEKISNFTDWIGDRWYDFESWIGVLNIRNYINNVNEYHKKVIDKNNATQSSINTIFYKVKEVDILHQRIFSEKKMLLIYWQKYIDELNQIVNPGNGLFDAEYISYSLNQSLQLISKFKVDESKFKSNEELMKEVLNGEAKLLKMLSEQISKRNNIKTNDSKKNKNMPNDLELTSSAMSYIAGLYTFYTADYENASDMITGALKLTKSTTSMWKGVYKYLEKSLKTMEASRFGKKYQSKVGIASLIGSMCGFTSDAIGTFKTMIDEESEGYEKVSALLKNTSSGTDVAQSIVNLKWGQKVLTRDIHAKYQWGTATKNVAKVDKAGTIIAVVGVVADTGVGMADRYGKVSVDGVVDSKDIGEIGVAGSVRGLTSVVSGLTGGISDVVGLSDKAEDISDGLIEFANTDGTNFAVSHKHSREYLENTGFIKDYADDERNNIVFRVGASAIAGIGMVHAMAIDGVEECQSWIKNKISDGWQTMTNCF